MKGGHHHRGCACQHLFRKVLAKCGCCYARVRDSYSAAGSEGSISTSVASLPPQASGSSAPSSPSSRRSVSTLKKWLTNPVRKLSAGAAGGSKGERPARKQESKPPPPQSKSNQELGSSRTAEEHLTILPITDKELEWRDGLPASEDSPGVLQSHSHQSDFLQGSTSQVSLLHTDTERLTQHITSMRF
ncbi:kalirin-like isoform X2 [Astyanax mexicanus]|uniref:kalirin-like isoform X2 n=1 Tax=Astyanax mexicanus TaxID=7994 RepID=UPI0020CAF3A7|nr:kalirin-like isoform X2 [Astyanax mexicanus]